MYLDYRLNLLFRNKNGEKSGIAVCSKALSYLSDEIDNWQLQAGILKKRGDVFELIGNYERANHCFEKLLSLAQKWDDLKEQGR